MKQGAWTLLLYMTSIFCYGKEINTPERLVHIGIELQDASTELAVYNAKVSVMDTAGLCLTDSLSMVVRKPSWDSEVYEVTTYSGDLPYRASYQLNISAPGYQSLRLNVKPDADNSILIKPIYMINEKQTRQLDEVSVTASRIKMVHDGDTLVYNAAAFRLPEGSMLDALIDALPGAKIDRDGKITVNGEFVKELLINGRRFFSGNPQVALQNLPSYTVNKIKVYKKDSDEEGSMLTNKQELVMDVNLRREYSNSWIATAEGGAGTTMGKPNDLRWMGRIFGTRFNRGGYTAVYVSANNLNNSGGANRRGEWEDPSTTTGIVTSKRAGAEYSVDWRDQAHKGITTSIEVLRKTSLSTEQDFSELYLPEGNVFNNSLHSQDSKDWQLKWVGNLSRKFEKAGDLRFESSMEYTDGWDKTLQSVEEKEADGQPLYQRNRLNNGSNNWFNTTGRLEFRPKPIGTFSSLLSAKASYEKRKAGSEDEDRINYPADPRQNIWLRQNLNQSQLNWYYLLRAEIYKYWSFSENGSISAMIGYNFRHSYADDTRRLEESPLEESILTPSYAFERELDLINSYRRLLYTDNHSLSGRIITTFKSFHMFIVADINQSKRTLQEKRADNYLKLKRNNLLYKVDWEATKTISQQSLRLRFNYEQKAPEMIYYLDIIDTSNPMNLRLGNPKLKNPNIYSCSFMWSRRWDKRQTSISASLDYTWANRAIAMSRTYDRETGVSIISPDNINGNRSLSVPIYFSSFLGPNQKLFLSNNLTPTFARSVDFSSEGNISVVSKVTNRNLTDNLEIEYEVNDALQLNTGIDLSCSLLKSNSNLFNSFSFTDINYKLGINYSAPWEINIATNLSVYTRRGYSEKTMNRTDWVWNLELSRPIYKGWSIKLTGFDLLQQLPTIRQVVTPQGRYETRYNSQPSYALLTIAYRLDIKPKKK